MGRFAGIPVDDAVSGSKFGGVLVEDETTTTDNAETPVVSDTVMPGALNELATGAHRSIASMIDFLGPDRFNDVLRAVGSQYQVPTLSASVPQKGAYDPSLIGRAAGAAGEILPAAMMIGQGLRTAAGRLSPTAAASESAGAGVLRQMGQTTAGMDVTGAALAGAGQEVGREVGGETGAMIGGVLGPMIPAAGASIIKGAFAGGESGKKTLSKAISDFAEIGETPSVGIGTGNRIRQGLENLSSKVLGGSSVRRSFERAESSMQRRLTEIADDISKVKGDYEAGLVIKRGIQNEGGFVDRFQNQSSTLWKAFDSQIDDAANVQAKNTSQALNSMVNDTEFGQILNNPLVARIKTALDNSGGAIDYRTFRALRSSIGERLGGNDITSDIPRQQLKRLYGALSEDLRGVAAESGDDALRALTRANKFTSAGHKRIDDFVNRLTNKVDLDRVFTAVTRGGEGIQSINAVKRSLKPDEWEVVASNVIRKLGTASPGQQDLTGELFSMNKFLTDWNKLGRAKNAIFSGSKRLDEYRANLDRIASIAGRYKEAAKEFANPSGTGQFLTNVGLVSGAGSALATGNLPAAGAIIAGVSANSAASRLMTSPTFVKWLASSTKAPSLAGPIVQLATVAKSTGEYDAISELIGTLKEASPAQGKEGK